MSKEQMIKQLREWNPHWNIEKIKSWKTMQLHAIYTKELDKNIKQNKKVKYEQLSLNGF